MGQVSFSDIAIVSCGTLSLDLRYLQKSGFLDARHIFYNTPGLHERPAELERQLIYRINKAKEKAATKNNGKRSHRKWPVEKRYGG